MSNTVYKINAETLTDIADAIREKTGSTETLKPSEMAEAIEGIEGGGSGDDTKLINLVTGNLSGTFSYDEITKLKNYALADYSSLAAVNLPNCSVIGRYAFSYCRALSDIHFPKCITIGEGAFMDCYSLTSVSFPSCTSVGGNAFNKCSRLENLNFPSCTTIGSSAFQNCSSLTSVNFPSCTTIGSSAFQNCSSLTSVNFPVCTTIEYNAFQRCSSLTSVSFPVCTTIEYSAFQNCSSLTSVSFPSCTTIGTNVFQACSSLTSVSFPSCTTIGSSAFQNCSSLTSVNFPVCISIGNSAFQSCYSLTSVNFPVCTTIGTNVFYSCSSLTSVNFPVCTTIGTNVFQACYSLTSVNFPVCSVTGRDMFSSCSSLTNVSLPECRTLYQGTFVHCTNLSVIDVPKCTNLQQWVFQDCYNLLSLYLRSPTMCQLSHINVFERTPMSSNTSYTGGVHGSIFVPYILYSKYLSATNWTYFASRITQFHENIIHWTGLKQSGIINGSISCEYYYDTETNEVPSISVATSSQTCSVDNLVTEDNRITFTISDTVGENVVITVTAELADGTTFSSESVFKILGAYDYIVEPVSDAAYGFLLNENDFYESQNKNISSSAAVCILTYFAPSKRLYIDCINSGESNYDYGILSKIDVTLVETNVADDSGKVYKSFRGQSSFDVQTVDYGIQDEQEHFIYIKYIKDSSSNSDNDSLQFKIRFED